jgi:hypothetical protein
MKARFRIAPGLHEQCGIESLEGRFQGCLVGTMGSISLRFAGGSPSSGSRRCRVSAMARTSGSGGIWGCSAFIFFLPCGGEFGPSEFEMGHISSDSPPGPDGATTHGPQVACVRRENDQRNGERY